MRNCIYILIFIVFGQVLCSCDDNLDRFPKDKLVPDDFFKTEKDLELYSNSFYTQFPGESGIMRENVDAQTHLSLTLELSGSRTVPGTGGGWDWTQLRDINVLLSYSHQCTDKAVRTQYDALARFFRAYFYFEKIKRFGDVPWYDKPLASDDPDLMKPRDSREYVMKKMLEDLEYAITNLPSGNEKYRVTRWTAMALMSRVCLFEGTFRKYHNLVVDGVDYKFYLEQAALISEEFINKSSYKLYTGSHETVYRDLFASLDVIDTEVILARNYNQEFGVTHNANFYTLGTSMGRPGLTKKIINSYLMTDGSRFTDKPGYETMLFKDETKNRDLRLSQTIRTPGYKRIGSTQALPPNLVYTVTGYQPIKFVTEAKYDSNDKSMNDMPLFRTAEVYLNLAEAKAELETLTQDDLDKTVNLIRARVGMPSLNMAAANANPDPYLMSDKTGYPHVQGANKGVILEIRRERSIELIMEGFRYYDMIRWKEGKTFEADFNGIYIPSLGDFDIDGDGVVDVCFYVGTRPGTSAPLSYNVGEDIFLSGETSGYISPHKTVPRRWNEERDYLYPIPTTERQNTNGALTQNPGWNDGLDY